LVVRLGQDSYLNQEFPHVKASINFQSAAQRD
jgi:hypothetical protein